MTPDDTLALHNVSLGMGTPDVPVTGMNSALRRLPKVETSETGVTLRPGFVPAWKPYWPKPKTVALTFPEGIEFLPPKRENDDRELKSI
ncbi:MAG: ATP-dependent helicase, partial [Planctomycetaceae bacterium]|nr:ATP-dependent helicase [Planctomycetaceae bacterium]